MQQKISENSAPLSKYPNFKGVVVITISFFVLFLGYTSAGNITTKALRDNGYQNMGYYSLSAVYFSFATSSLFMSNVLKIMKPKTSMIIGSTMYFLWGLSLCLTVLTFKSEYYRELVSYNMVCAIVIFTGILNGIGGGMVWIAQGKYLSDCSKICPQKKGFYQGFFWSISLCGSSSGASIINLVILKSMSEFEMFLISGFIMLSTILVLFFLPDVTLPPGESSVQQGMISMQDIKRNLQSVYEFSIQKRYMKTYGLIIVYGVSLSLRQSVLIPLHSKTLADKTVQEQYFLSGCAMIFVGVGSLVGGNMIGKVNDSQGGGKQVAKAVLLIHLVNFGALIVYNEMNSFGLLSFIASFTSGVADSALQTQISLILGFEFTSNVESFMSFRFISSMSVMLIVTLIYPYIHTISDYRILFLSFLFLSIVSEVLIYLKFDFQQVKPKKNLLNSVNADEEIEVNILSNKIQTKS